jgi:hypothetical protein
VPAGFEGLFSGGDKPKRVELQLLGRDLRDHEVPVVHGIE